MPLQSLPAELLHFILAFATAKAACLVCRRWCSLVHLVHLSGGGLPSASVAAQLRSRTTTVSLCVGEWPSRDAELGMVLRGLQGSGVLSSVSLVLHRAGADTVAALAP
eukprot:RCo013007